jgi:hypothetical protein
VRAVRVRETILVDGVDNDPGWRECPETEVALTGDKGPSSVFVKACVFRGTVFLLTRWRCTKTSMGYVVSIGGPGAGGGDELDVFLPISGPFDPSVEGSWGTSTRLDVRSIEDVWQWNAHWTDGCGYANDGTVELPRPPDDQEHNNGWEVHLQDDREGRPWTDPAHSPASSKDVLARGRWTDGTWTVEFARALTTRYSDDRDLGGLPEVPFGLVVASSNGSELHAVHSPVLRLLLPPAEDPRQAPLPEPLGPPAGGR